MIGILAGLGLPASRRGHRHLRIGHQGGLWGGVAARRITP
jgi:hypothetical protein